MDFTISLGDSTERWRLPNRVVLVRRLTDSLRNSGLGGQRVLCFATYSGINTSDEYDVVLRKIGARGSGGLRGRPVRFEAPIIESSVHVLLLGRALLSQFLRMLHYLAESYYRSDLGDRAVGRLSLRTELAGKSLHMVIAIFDRGLLVFEKLDQRAGRTVGLYRRGKCAALHLTFPRPGDVGPLPFFPLEVLSVGAIVEVPLPLGFVRVLTCGKAMTHYGTPVGDRHLARVRILDRTLI